MKKPLPILKNRKWWYAISLALIATSLVIMFSGSMKFGIDFVGGTLHEVSYQNERPQNKEIEDIVKEIVGEVKVQPSGDKNVILRYRNVDNETRQKVLDKLSKDKNKVNEERFESIGPTIGNELKRKAIWAIILVMGAIILYLTYAFRKVSRPVQSWKYGILAIVCLFHDVTLMAGTYGVLCILRGAEIDTLFLVAMLTTLGYSVHDTIVVFDRTRTNLMQLGEDKFKKAVDLATSQTITRSINTSLTTAIPLSALLIFGGDTLFNFVLALLVGLFFGSYSSIFIASPLLVTWYKISNKHKTV